MTPELHSYILMRDGGCCARFTRDPLDRRRWPMLAALDDAGPCRNEFGGTMSAWTLIGLTLDHVEDADQLDFIHKAPTDAWHLWTLCPGHHGLATYAGFKWATQECVREAARLYIPAAIEAARKYRGLEPPAVGEAA